eukprot:SAG22_NODE_2740_length_2260_cov_2.658491_2_plen_217_part_00
MLEVGVTNAQLPLPGKKCNCGPTMEEPCPPLTRTEARSHFGAFAIVSSPLVLGFNLTDEAQLQLHWDTISNTHAIEVNQDYAGFSGSRFAQSAEIERFFPCDWGPSAGRQDASCDWPATWSWYKPLSGRDPRNSTMGVLLMNNKANSCATIGFQWREVPGLQPPRAPHQQSQRSLSSCEVFDVWEKKSLGRVTSAGFTAKDLPPRDSAFVTLSNCY